MQRLIEFQRQQTRHQTPNRSEVLVKDELYQQIQQVKEQSEKLLEVLANDQAFKSLSPNNHIIGELQGLLGTLNTEIKHGHLKNEGSQILHTATEHAPEKTGPVAVSQDTSVQPHKVEKQPKKLAVEPLQNKTLSDNLPKNGTSSLIIGSVNV